MTSNPLLREHILYLAYHVFLPRQLPTKDDTKPARDDALVRIVLSCLYGFSTMAAEPAVQRTVQMMEQMAAVHETGESYSAAEHRLGDALEQLRQGARGISIPVYVAAQNAGVIFTAAAPDVHCEVFELSPPNKDVMGVTGRLRRSFPASGVAIPQDRFDRRLCAALSSTLAKMGRQEVAGTRPKAKKEKKMHDEQRDTTDPKMVTTFLATWLLAHGHPARSSTITKNTREEVLYSSGRLPWRRSPVWLLVRVALQLSLSRPPTTAAQDGALYKEFMMYFLADILRDAVSSELESDLLFTMYAKLNRRLRKSAGRAAVRTHVQAAMAVTITTLQKRWALIQEQDTGRVNLTSLYREDWRADARATLPGLDEFIRACRTRTASLSATVDFQPTTMMTYYTPLELPNLSSSGHSTELDPVDLLSFEGWVAEHLDGWLAAHISDDDVCQSLAARLYDYHTRMTRLYAKNPESMSIMILTLLELWVACDKAAVHNCQLLNEYDAGVPSHLLQCLLLPHKADMERLGRIEAYLALRASQATFESSDVFMAFGTANCFAARWFMQSRTHQALRQRIEASAHQRRESKRAELQQCKDTYQSLINLHNSSDHNNTSVWEKWSETWEDQHVPKSCDKCRYMKQANATQIKIHEWPLPRDELQTRSVVFELDVPPSFGHWRDLTLFLKLNALQGRYSTEAKPRCHYTVDRYQGLAGFFVSWSTTTQRNVLLSQDKPHSETHRNSRPVNNATRDSDVCLDNGLHYAYYDNSTGFYVDHVYFSGKLEMLCMYTMPSASASLQQFLYRPAEQASGPSPNTAIASKSDCPDHFSEDEYAALCTIPLGNRIQWTNILVQLHAPAVALKKVETLLTLLQCMLQAGPPDGDISRPRENHAIVEEVRFASRLLDGLDLQLQHVQANWQATYTITALICLGCRLCTLVADATVQARCLAFLYRCQVVVLDWLTALQDQIGRVTEEEARCALRAKAVIVAMTCLCTFDLDQHILARTLNERDQASVFIRCTIVVREGHNSVAPDSGAFMHILRRRVQRLQHRSWRLLSAYIVGKDAEALHDAVRQSWPAYQTTVGWWPLPKHNYWLETRAGNHGTASTLQVHFNLLDGDLRVSGEPLGRLPDEYERHPTYRALFGRSRLEVMPSALPGMRFSGKSTFYDYTLHFGHGGEDLALRASRGDRCYELIPRRLLDGFYPTLLRNDHVLWYNVEGDCVEFRRNDNAWDASDAVWVLRRTGDDDTWQLQNDDGCVMLPTQSSTAMLVSQPLEPLEDPPYIHCLLLASETLEVHLPRLQLEFSTRQDDDKLSSRQYRGLFVDPMQSAGTFVGLKNKLILRGDGDSPRRIILVPNGSVSCSRDEGHVRVSIQKGSMKRAESYEMDAELGRLRDRGSHENLLYQCYLHALTAFCLPDPLTRVTGTEQALSILTGAAVESFESLSEASIHLLKKIADLTPARCYYPNHLKCMQVVEWSSKLGSLAQHDNFQAHVHALYTKHNDMTIFSTTGYVRPMDLQEVDETLRIRDMNRSAAVRISGFGAECFNPDRDVDYAGRGEWQDSNAAKRVFSITSFLLRRSLHPFYDISVDLVSHMWSYLFSSHVYSAASLSAKLEYDACWLVDSQPFISEEWLSLHSFISRDRAWGPSGDVVMWMATLAFADDANVPALHILACFYIMPEMLSITLPDAAIFYIRRGYIFDGGALQQSIRNVRYPLERCPSLQLTQNYKEKGGAFKQRQMKALTKISNPLCEEMVQELRRQWPCQSPSLVPSTSTAAYFNMTQVQSAAQELFDHWNNNIRFRQYLREVANQAYIETVPLDIDTPSSTADERIPERRQAFVAAADIFSHAAPVLEPFQALDLQQFVRLQSVSRTQETAMKELIAHLHTSATWPYEVQYVRHLESSYRSVQDNDQRWKVVSGESTLAAVVASLGTQARARVDYIYSEMQQAIGVTQAENDASIYMWPRITPLFFLQHLAQRRWAALPDGWRGAIVEYGCAVTALQRAQRLVSVCGDAGKFVAELQNPGHTGWNPREHPEWLLLEVENGILIRPVQHQIAKRMSAPVSDTNEIMQLIMGGGKSSVIVPMVALALADGRRLVRVIVAKPQAKQMLAMLVAKLGRLLGRRVFFMPFSRSVRVRPQEVAVLLRLHQQCMAAGGVLLVQPEHILSFQLMAVEKCIAGAAAAENMFQTLQFLHGHARDIIDESDEILSVKYEIVYTMGAQRAVDHAPGRWIVIAEVLDMVRRCVPMVQARWPDAVEVHPGHDGCFPRTRILRHDAMTMLQTLVATSLCERGMTGFPVAQQSKEVRSAVRCYINQPQLTEEGRALVEVGSGFVTEETRDTLLLLRGLLAQGILSFVLEKKRWRVDYGLDPARLRPTRLAVPFRAKDLPTDRSEFSHPDVVIALTSLCYYYTGLSDDDLMLSIRHLQQSDQADMEYQDWVKDAFNLPPSLQQLVSVNLDDRHGCTNRLFPCFRFAKTAIDYFLAYIVFPKEMKEFPHKLSASGWDIAATRRNPTTGFSGTNDSRIILPLSVQQIDLDEQTHTNALVLAYLLQPENSALPMLHAPDGASSDAKRLLAAVTAMDPPVRVILDVGAQILELDNIGVAQAWLYMLSDDEATHAAIFVDKDDHICVLDRKGYVEPLHTSPFATQLDACVVFLDEAHTRGIDLTLPHYYRAAVTLGANLTKDRLVQACMRMRRLGHGQSVVFCVPREICAKLHTDRPTVAEILQWAIQGTWQDAARSVPLWAVQGRRHHAQSTVWTAAQTADGTLQMTSPQAREFLEQEAVSIEGRYAPRMHTAAAGGDDAISQRFRAFKPVDHFAATLSEEQERELSPEIEREREVQRAAPEKPARHALHSDMVAYVATGRMAADSSARLPAFGSLSATSAARYLDLDACPRHVYVSLDFARTVEGAGSDDTQRPAQWILVSPPRSRAPVVDVVTVISPYEAQMLLPAIRESTRVALCLYAPRPNQGYRALDGLDLYTVPEQPEACVPPQFIIGLNLFAGQLYFGSELEAIRVCRYLGIDLYTNDADAVHRTAVMLCSMDGFTQSPIKFLQVFLSQVRRGCSGIGKTHLGSILDSRRPKDL